MIGHKPECPANWGVGEMPEGPCTFCEMLSACEQRVWKDPLLVVSRRAGWNDALISAREAVATMKFDSLQRDQGPVATQRQVLAAIDALKEKQ